MHTVVMKKLHINSPKEANSVFTLCYSTGALSKRLYLSPFLYSIYSDLASWNLHFSCPYLYQVTITNRTLGISKMHTKY